MISARPGGPTAMTERDPLLAPFDALIGTWDTEAKHRLVDEVVPGTVTFEWLEGGHFVVLRSHNDHDLFPDAIGVIGRPESGEGLVLEYFDSRGVRRTYAVSLEDGVPPPRRLEEPDRPVHPRVDPKDQPAVQPLGRRQTAATCAPWASMST